jgi:hypothetical protein
MPDWFVAGGVSMWFLMVVGALAMWAGGRFALRPDPSQLDRIRELRSALAWGSVAGVASDLAAVGYHIPNRPEWAHSPDLPLLVLQGVGESMSPALFGGAILSVIALLCAAGFGRMRTHGAAP